MSCPYFAEITFTLHGVTTFNALHGVTTFNALFETNWITLH